MIRLMIVLSFDLIEIFFRVFEINMVEILNDLNRFTDHLSRVKFVFFE